MNSPSPVSQTTGNPCINICRMDLAGRYCQGCGRTLLEIGRWDQMADTERVQALAAIAARRAPHTAAITTREQ